jgi:hypothetical protein
VRRFRVGKQRMGRSVWRNKTRRRDFTSFVVEGGAESTRILSIDKITEWLQRIPRNITQMGDAAHTQKALNLIVL